MYLVGAPSSPFASPQSAAWNPQKAIDEGASATGAAQPVGQTPGAHAGFVVVVLLLLVLVVAYHRGALPFISARASGTARA